MTTTEFTFSDAEIAAVLSMAETELEVRGWCTRHTSLATGEVCAVGAINVACFGHPDGQYYYSGDELDRQVALRVATLRALGYSDLLDLQAFSDQQATSRPVLELFAATRQNLMSVA